MVFKARPAFELEYRHDRRRHRHRCRCCNKIIDAGERVLMVSKRNGTWAIHITCADKPHSANGTWRDAFESWGTERLRKCGYPIPEHPYSMVGRS